LIYCAGREGAKMRIYISVDLEGVAGVVHVDQTRRSGHDYERARRWMTAEANAAIGGAFDGGATAVLINDSHADMRNLVLDDLDPRAEFISGNLKPHSMVEGVTEDFTAAFFVGYHAGASSRAGILDHTYFGAVVTRVRVDGREMSEAGINALVCGEMGVPVVLVTGDQVACGQAKALLGDIETVIVKEGITRYSARSLHPQVAQRRIREGAKRAAERARGSAPFKLQTPHRLEVDFVNAAMADAANMVPDTTREGALAVAYEARTPSRLLKMLVVMTKLAGTTIP
jgi:D-amino peptidase